MRKETLIISLICGILLLSIIPISCEKDYVLVKKIEILSGPKIGENGLVYIQEDKEYLVRLELVFPVLSGKTFKVESYLHGFIRIVEKNMSSRLGSIAFESLHIPQTLTIELEGIAPKALVKIEGSKTTTADDRTIKGERAFNFFSVYADNVPVQLNYEEELNVVLSSEEILEAKRKIKEAEDVIAKMELCGVSDLHITKSLISRMKNLVEIAKRCLAEGAPTEASALANECLELARIPVTKDQVYALNSLLAEFQGVDVAKSSKYAHLALEEIDKIDKENDFDTRLSFIEKTEEYYDEATQSLISEVNREATKYEISPAYFVLIVAVLLGISLVPIFFVVSQKREKAIYERAVKIGEEKAARKGVSPRDIITGKGEGENE
jgi:hypothetical protein